MRIQTTYTLFIMASDDQYNRIGLQDSNRKQSLIKREQMRKERKKSKNK